MSNELTAPTKVGVDPITTALVAAGVTSASIEQLSKDYGALAQQTQPLETPEEYEVVKRAQLACRDVRTAVISALKIEREEAKRYQQFVIQEEKRILAEIAKTEEPLKKLREDYDNREALKAQEEARQWVEKMNLRKQAAFDIGYTFNGAAYVLDRENGEAPWVLREDQVAGLAMSDEALYALLEAQAAELKMTREIKAEAEAKAKEEEWAREAAQKAEAARIAAAQAEIERREKDMAEKERQMNERLLKSRTDAIRAIGGAQHGDGGWGWLEFRKPASEILAMSEEGFSAFVSEVKDKRIEWDADQELARQKKEQERVAREEQMKAEAEERGRQAEAARQAQAKVREEEGKELLAQQEAEERAQRGDLEKVMDFLGQVQILVERIPELKSAIGVSAMKSYRKQLAELSQSLTKLGNEL